MKWHIATHYRKEGKKVTQQEIPIKVLVVGYVNLLVTLS